MPKKEVSLGGTTEVSLESSERIVYTLAKTLAEAEIIMLYYRRKLATPRSPDGIRLGARDERVDYDTFRDSKGMHKLKGDAIDDDSRPIHLDQEGQAALQLTVMAQNDGPRFKSSNRCTRVH
jgi:hypothetical protein